MQTTQPLDSKIKTLADWLYDQWAPTDPIIVKNILDEPYFFRYCVNEEIETPEQNMKRVLRRDYQEITLEPGQEHILIGGQAYLFVDGIARTYAFKSEKNPEVAANATANIQRLIDCAQLAIVGKAGYNSQVQPIKPQASSVQPTAPVVPAHNPNVLQNDQPTGDTPFGDLNSNPPTAPEIPQDIYTTLPAISKNKAKELGVQPRDAIFLKNGVEISQEEYNEGSHAQQAA